MIRILVGGRSIVVVMLGVYSFGFVILFLWLDDKKWVLEANVELIYWMIVIDYNDRVVLYL